MALEGNLTAFGLSEILQLIAVQQKTGMLTVTNAENTTVMFFRRGELVSTRDRRRKARDTFKDYLTRYGVLAREELIRITQITSQSKLDFTEILISEDFLSREELRKHWRKQVQEAMHDVLTWEEGTYKFVTSEEIVDGIKSPELFNVEGMLMESMRRIDEFPQMLEMFPSEKLVFSRSDGKPDGKELTENEKTIHALIESPSSLRDLIARGKMPVFEVYESLKLLRDKGLLTMAEPESDGNEGAGEEAASRRTRKPIKNVFPFMIATVLFALAVLVGFRGARNYEVPQAVPVIELPAGPELSRDRLAQHLHWLIEAYYAQHGVYPSDLADLESSGLAESGVVEHARAHAFRYRLTSNPPGYTLL